ncbi:hypothetical protein NLX83_05350 [Allokutzneria sp. A3M-2-11 16]|uniref:hypothetical protein n=1 Tax=Allokutzneria sp. A3M-2-11 16 TaxID=2962043 RepID=UPI0020B89EC2|nr:hypothetical protein [Allokutzneria sp. A3M-2-11 16]MCP3798680.1 hypothetical protein [Allokutzneria sp. A3M-2-11 16]
MSRLGALVILGAVLAGAAATDSEPDRPLVEVVESGPVLQADLRTPVAGVAGNIISERDPAIRRTAWA